MKREKKGGRGEEVWRDKWEKRKEGKRRQNEERRDNMITRERLNEQLEKWRGGRKVYREGGREEGRGRVRWKKRKEEERKREINRWREIKRK